MIEYPLQFLEAVEKAKEKRGVTLSRLTAPMVQEFCELQNFEVVFYLKHYKRENKRMTKAEKRETAINTIQAMIDNTVDGINVEVEVSELEALLDLI